MNKRSIAPKALWLLGADILPAKVTFLQPPASATAYVTLFSGLSTIYSTVVGFAVHGVESIALAANSSSA